jgi:hypothetical protein
MTLSDIYIIYRPSPEVGGYVEKLGAYMNYCAGKIEEVYVDNRVQLSKFDATVVDKEIALAWLFADSYNGQASIKGETPAAQQMEHVVGKLEVGEKVKYQLTEEDKKNSVLFNKAVLNKIVEDRFAEKLRELQLSASELEKASWCAQEAEALATRRARGQRIPGMTPVLDILAGVRGISVGDMAERVLGAVEKHNIKVATLLAEEQKLKQEIKKCQTLADCHRLRHLKFGVSLTAKQAEDEGVEASPATLKITF